MICPTIVRVLRLICSLECLIIVKLRSLFARSQ